MSGDATALLSVEHLSVVFDDGGAAVSAVDDLSYALRAGETLAVVGESGSGKSVAALSVMGLLPSPPGRVSGGRVLHRGVDLLRLDDAALRRLRGAQIAMIFQEPMSSLNPVLSIGRQLTETLIAHQKLSPSAVRERALAMLRLVQISEPERRLRQYPHQLSGGMLQRVMIAMSLCCEPSVLIADEPTTALDVTIQAQVLALIKDLQRRLGTAVVLITHDLGVVAETADRVVVMYAGSKVEEADVETLFEYPQHPYTRGLLDAIPRLGGLRAAPNGGGGRARLREIPGAVPAPDRLPAGCRFAARCELADGRCRAERPPLAEKTPGQWAACWHSGRLTRRP